MRKGWMAAGTALALAAAGSAGGAAVLAAGAYGHMPDGWAAHATVCRPTQTAGDTLCDVVGVALLVPTSGSVQGREAYLYLAADSARALPAPVNVEVAGGRHLVVQSPGGHVSGPGQVEDWYALTGGVAVTDGQASIRRWHGLTLTRPARTAEAWGLDLTDATLPSRIRGDLEVGQVVTFANGWSLRTHGADGLDLYDRNGVARQFR